MAKKSLVKAPPENVKSFEYEAVEHSDKRKSAPARQKPHQDTILMPSRRKVAENATQDVLENIPLAGWMIRRHLDAVSSFYVDVDAKLPIETRKRIEGLFQWAGLARNFDAARRFSIGEAFRLFELNKVIDGDSLMVKINRRSSARYGAIQLVEGSRIKRPSDLPPFLAGMVSANVKKITDLGLELDEYGGAKSFIVCKYGPDNKTLVFDRRVLARDAIYSGYFERYSQTRGISPLLSALNQLLDIKEGMEHILLKIKLHALFGYAITRDAIDTIGDGLASASTVVYDEDPDSNDEDMPDTAREIDVSKGPFGLNLLDGEKVQTIESNTPPESVKAYTELAIRSALLALDIPFSFFDAAGSNFAKVIADRKMYEISIEAKRAKNQAAYEEYVDWKLAMWTADGALPMSYQEVREFVHVRSTPAPWLDKASEIDAEERAVSLGLKSIPQLARERGTDAYEVLQQQAEYLARAEELNVPVYIGHPGARSERDNRIDNDIRTEEADEDEESDDEA